MRKRDLVSYLTASVFFISVIGVMLLNASPIPGHTPRKQDTDLKNLNLNATTEPHDDLMKDPDRKIQPVSLPTIHILVMPSDVDSERRDTRLQAIAETWGDDALRLRKDTEHVSWMRLSVVVSKEALKQPSKTEPKLEFESEVSLVPDLPRRKKRNMLKQSKALGSSSLS